jgi:NADPH-dependent 2,4-dienoyl-CoA reductase/sulfur reductase-like enzyme
MCELDSRFRRNDTSFLRHRATPASASVQSRVRESRGTQCFWHQPDNRAPSLLEDARAEVCIVGGGIAGMTTAYLLNRAGHSVIVLDDGPIAGSETGRTTAHLSNAIDRLPERVRACYEES